jgi:hypothetical protein
LCSQEALQKRRADYIVKVTSSPELSGVHVHAMSDAPRNKNTRNRRKVEGFSEASEYN